MNAFLLKKSKLIVLLFSLFSLWSCQKNVDGSINNPSDQIPDLTTKVNSSVSGFVTDENNIAVIGATVNIGNRTTNTDNYGYFQVRNVDVVKTAAVVTVSKAGYFHGIKTYIATESKSAFFRIKLIPKNTTGTFSASAGGSVSLASGMSISFPLDAIVNAASGVAYAGVVNVAASWINPTSTDVNPTMPGDLRGLNDGGAIKILQSFGMAAVELTGASGELLQIASGKKATITFPVPAALISNAPATIPLWYFDEATGLWKEEGSATKTGNNYVGEVSHFSFWNCDVPNNYIQFNCTILDANGNPMPYVAVRISVVGSLYNSGWGWTDSSGYVGGAIPNNASLSLEVFTNYNCGTAAYTQAFSTTSTSISLGNITIPNTVLNTANVSGTVTNCSSGPVSNGYIIMQKDNQYSRYSLSNTGTYDFSTLLCSTNAPVILIGEDISVGQQSTPLSYTIVSGNNVVPNLQACGITTEQFFNYTVNGANTAFTSPADTFYMYVNNQMNPPRIEFSAQNIVSGGSTGFGTIGFDQTGITVGSAQPMSLFYVTNINDSTYFTTPINVNITEYGNVGEFISGNFAGSMSGAAPLNTVYNINGNFRVRRNQ